MRILYVAFVWADHRDRDQQDRLLSEAGFAGRGDVFEDADEAHTWFAVRVSALRRADPGGGWHGGVQRTELPN